MRTSNSPGAEQLAQWLAERIYQDEDAPAGSVTVRNLRRAGVGQSSETLLFTASWDRGEGAFVLRVQPDPDGIFLSPDAVREFRVLHGLAGYPDVPAPRVRWVEPDPALLGAPFFVMDQVSGTVPSGKPSIHQVGWLPTLDMRKRRRLAASAIESLAAVHAVDWRRTHDFLRPDRDSEPDLAAHLAHIRRWHRWAAKGRRFEIVDTALTYVLDRAGSVREGEPVLLWGDARLGNTMFDEQSLAVSALLDWETASVGPRGIDLAHWLIFDEFATTAAGIDPLPGYPDHDTIVEEYQRHSGTTVADLDYFEVLQCLFIAITLIRQADAAVRSGRIPPGTRMAHDNTMTQMLARRLGLPVPDLSPDYLAHRRPPTP
ncbi:MAG TPA: phosphotransferase family protein [Amycolatopsis sp.]|nr:phosphotransferase family protein [Amycolatopsis sp.]